MELKDTVEMMNSSDYKERFKAEYYQTKIRYDKLEKFVNKIKACQYFETEDRMPAHDCPVGMLIEQLDNMRYYLNLLQQRAFIESIEL